LFSNLDPPEIVILINTFFLDPAWEMTAWKLTDE